MAGWSLDLIGNHEQAQGLGPEVGAKASGQTPPRGSRARGARSAATPCWAAHALALRHVLEDFLRSDDLAARIDLVEIREEPVVCDRAFELERQAP